LQPQTPHLQSLQLQFLPSHFGHLQSLQPQAAVAGLAVAVGSAVANAYVNATGAAKSSAKAENRFMIRYSY
jgi:hypothetical protein